MRYGDRIVSVEWQQDGRLSIVRCAGAYEAEELIGALDKIVANPELPEDARLLLDLRQSESVLGRPIRDLRRVTFHFGKHSSRFGSRCALLVRGTARFGLMRMASMWIESRGVHADVFRDEASAREWLLRSSPTPDER